MKREKVTYPIVRHIKPFFWRTCRFCQMEFKKELGYEIEELPSIKTNRYQTHIFSYCCNECSNNINELKEKVITERNWKPSN